ACPPPRRPPPSGPRKGWPHEAPGARTASAPATQRPGSWCPAAGARHGAPSTPPAGPSPGTSPGRTGPSSRFAWPGPARRTASPLPRCTSRPCWAEHRLDATVKRRLNVLLTEHLIDCLGKLAEVLLPPVPLPQRLPLLGQEGRADPGALLGGHLDALPGGGPR